MAYLFSSESLSLSTILLTEWLGPTRNDVQEALFQNCQGILLESWHGLCLTFPQGFSYSSCSCGPRLITHQACPTLSCGKSNLECSSPQDKKAAMFCTNLIFCVCYHHQRANLNNNFNIQQGCKKQFIVYIIDFLCLLSPSKI
jgi:hypothetical protein